METIGKKIKNLRKEKNISQEELAYKLKVSRQTIHRWEGNVMQPSTESINALCKYFDVKSDYLFGNSLADEEVAVVDGGEVRTKSKSKPFIISLAAFAVSAVVFIAFTVLSIWSGLTVFSNNRGIEQISTTQTTAVMFIGFIFLAVCSLIATVISSVFIIKSKCKPNVTQM